MRSTDGDNREKEEPKKKVFIEFAICKLSATTLIDLVNVCATMENFIKTNVLHRI